ncbi:hypothetical protein L596_023411 [Steinernema carpocapsae]|uniref:Mediator of RNA polymerase II transcription subunit 11 n=1 Tax=Steinernema carpocapsae TaxID=34508 RepID=A0A4U5MDK3_STECR|nr:hypothetical protein L596_023411 [Steinernema carpocapsae]
MQQPQNPTNSASSSSAAANPAAFRIPNPPQANEELQKRLNSLETVDKKINDLLKSAQSIIGDLSKEKQITKTKTDEAAQSFKNNLQSIETTIMTQLTYLEKLCSSSNHQGSAFAPEENMRHVDALNEMLVSDLVRIKEKYFPVEEEQKNEEVKIKEEVVDDYFQLDDYNL